jgi:hypothetical protein
MKKETRRGERKERKGEERKRKHPVSKTIYVHRLTDERTWVVQRKPCPCMFVGQAMSLTNISHIYSSVTWPDRRMYVVVPCQPGRNIHSLVS